MSRATTRAQAAVNRRLRRDAVAVQHATGRMLVRPEEVAELRHIQRLFMALVKQLGRVRITEREVAELRDGDSLRAREDAGALTITFTPAAAEAAEEKTDGS